MAFSAKEKGKKGEKRGGGRCALRKYLWGGGVVGGGGGGGGGEEERKKERTKECREVPERFSYVHLVLSFKSPSQRSYT